MNAKERKQEKTGNMKKELMAPCGMNCRLCVAYQYKEMNINKHGFHRTYCPGCIPRGKNCTHMKDVCDRLGSGRVRFCFECDDYPCKRLKALDKRYRTKYHMSMIHNLDFIKENGLVSFLENEEKKWICPTCGGVICCHNGLCLHCQLDILLKNRKYRWNEENNHGITE